MPGGYLAVTSSAANRNVPRQPVRGSHDRPRVGVHDKSCPFSSRHPSPSDAGVIVADVCFPENATVFVGRDSDLLAIAAARARGEHVVILGSWPGHGKMLAMQTHAANPAPVVPYIDRSSAGNP